MYEQALFKNRREDRPATFDEYRAGGGYQALTDTVKKLSPQELIQALKESGLEGRGRLPHLAQMELCAPRRPSPALRRRQHR